MHERACAGTWVAGAVAVWAFAACGDDRSPMGNPDSDGDGWESVVELACGTDASDASSFPMDTDGDSMCDSLDVDDDGDGWSDSEELVCHSDPLDPSSVPFDADGDRACNATDPDDDDDGWDDTDEIACQTDALDAGSVPLDTDQDLVCDPLDDDDDGDGWEDADEYACGTDPLDRTSAPLDTDQDLVCDPLDDDDDGDGWADTAEAACLTDALSVSSVPVDTDGDTSCDRVDADDDDDTWTDADEVECHSDPLDPASVPLDVTGDHVCNPWGAVPPPNAWYGLGPSEPAPWQVRAWGSTRGGGVSGATGSSKAPHLIVPSDGAPVAVWTQTRCVEWGSGCAFLGAVYLRRYDGSVWSELGSSARLGGLSGTDGRSLARSVALSPAGEPTVAWVHSPDFPPSGTTSLWVAGYDGEAWTELAGSANELGFSRGSATYNTVDIAVAVDSSGAAIVAWIQEEDQVFVERCENGGWEPIVGSASNGGIGPPALYVTSVDIGLQADDTPVVAWRAVEQGGDQADYFVATPDAEGWQLLPAVAAAQAPSSYRGLSLRVDATGNPVLAFVDDSSGSDAVFLKRFSSGTWNEIDGSGSGLGLGPYDSFYNTLALALTPSGEPVVAWVDTTSTAHVAHHIGSTWQDIAPRAPFAEQVVEGISVAVASNGDPLVAWTSQVNSMSAALFVSQLTPDGWHPLGDDYSDRGFGAGEVYHIEIAADHGMRPAVSWAARATSSESIGVFNMVWTGAEWSARPGSIDDTGKIGSTDGYPLLRSTATTAGRDLVLWNDPAPAVAVARHDGSTWTGSSLALPESTGSFGGDPSGRVVAVWVNPADGALLAKRLDGTTVEELGSPSEPAGLPPAGIAYGSAAIAFGPEEQPVVAWIRSSDATNHRRGEVYLARYDGTTWEEVDGSASYPGLSAGDETAMRSILDVLVDPSGEPFVVWSRGSLFDELSNAEVYAVRHETTGWSGVDGSASGGGLSQTPGFSTNPTAALDAGGNPVVAWVDTSNGPAEVYLRHLHEGHWFEHWGSATAGGVSNSGSSSWLPSLAVDEKRICVSYIEGGPPQRGMVRCSDL